VRAAAAGLRFIGFDRREAGAGVDHLESHAFGTLTAFGRTAQASCVVLDSATTPSRTTPVPGRR